MVYAILFWIVTWTARTKTAFTRKKIRVLVTVYTHKLLSDIITQIHKFNMIVPLTNLQKKFLGGNNVLLSLLFGQLGAISYSAR